MSVESKLLDKPSFNFEGVSMIVLAPMLGTQKRQLAL